MDLLFPPDVAPENLPHGTLRHLKVVLETDAESWMCESEDHGQEGADEVSGNLDV